MFEIMDEEPEPKDMEQALSIQNPKGDITNYNTLCLVILLTDLF